MVFCARGKVPVVLAFGPGQIAAGIPSPPLDEFALSRGVNGMPRSS